MSKHFPHLFSPLRVGNLTLKNRIIAAPTSLMDLTAEGYLTPDNICYYELKALGGAAVVTVGESIVHTATGQSHNRQICLDDPNSLPGLTRTATSIKRAGALASIELSHGGKYAGLASIGGDHTGGKKPYGPSDAVTADGERVYEMSIDMIETIIAGFGAGARLCKTAGFDIVMVHAAHGWLFNQFLSPLENKRTDEYGGSLENRARFLTRVLKEVRTAVGSGFPIELRMNGDDCIPGAVTTDEYLALARMVEPFIDMFNISCASHDAEGLFVRTHPSMFLEHGCNVYLAEAIKKVVSIPVSCVGGIHSPELAEEIIATGKADIVMLGRALLADPYFPKKAMRGQQDDITPCLRCFCCFENTINRAVLRCTVNPVIGNELDVRYHSPHTSNPRRVLVVGGGPGGMEAAITAAQAGHDVVLCEQTHELGGALSFAKEVPFKRELYDFARVLARRVRREKIRVDLNTVADADYVKGIAPDVIILAVGAKPIVPPIPGMDGANVRLAADCEGKGATLGQRVVIVGGGLVGCELGLSLGMEGKQVTLVEMRGELAPDANDLHKMAMKPQFEKYITPAVNTKVTKITPDGVLGTDAAGAEVFFPADTVVLAAGLKSDTATVEALYGLADEVYPIGDCKRVGQVLQAVTEGYFVARDL